MNPGLPNRPIAIYHFHPHLNNLMLSSGSYTIHKIEISNLWYYEITVSKGTSQEVKFYVLDHKF